MRKRDEQRVHDWLDAFEAEIAEQSREDLRTTLALIDLETTLWMTGRFTRKDADQVMEALLRWCKRHPDASGMLPSVVRSLGYLAEWGMLGKRALEAIGGVDQVLENLVSSIRRGGRTWQSVA